MRLRTVLFEGHPLACVALPDGSLARVDKVLPGAPTDLVALLETGSLDELAVAVDTGVTDDACVPASTRSALIPMRTRVPGCIPMGLSDV